MKMIAALSVLLSLNAFAVAGSKKFHCREFGKQDPFEIYVHTIVYSVDAYAVFVMNQDLSPMPLNYPHLVFNEAGQITALEASAFTDRLDMTLIEGKWKAEYWNDNVLYRLTCQEY